MSRFSQFGNDLYSGRRSFDIVGRRRFWYAVSAVLVVVSLLGIFGRGLNFGIEFSGGTELRVLGVSQMEGYEQRAGDESGFLQSRSHRVGHFNELRRRPGCAVIAQQRGFRSQRILARDGTRSHEQVHIAIAVKIGAADG